MSNYHPIPIAANTLGVPEETLRRLVALNIVESKTEHNTLLIDTAAAAVFIGADIEDPDSLEDASLALSIRRIKKLDVEIQQKQLAYQTSIGQVVPVETVRQEQLKRIRTVRTVLLSVPSSLAYKLVGKPLESIEKELSDEVHRILTIFSGGAGGVEGSGVDTPE